MIRIHTLAIQEIREARDGYDARNPILGVAFEEAIGCIEEGPERWPMGDKM